MIRKLLLAVVAMIVAPAALPAPAFGQPVDDNYVIWTEIVGCGFSVPVHHSLGYFKCDDSSAVPAFVYQLGQASTVSTAKAGVACDAFREGACSIEATNFLGDGVVRVQTDWNSQGVEGCPLSEDSTGRLLLIAVGSDGASVIASISGSEPMLGYLVDLAHPASEKGDILPLACDARQSKPQILQATAGRLDLQFPAPRISSDCDADSLGAYAHSRGLVSRSTCADGFVPKGTQGTIYTTTTRCSSVPELDKTRWRSTGVVPDESGKASITYMKPSDTNQCVFVGSTIVIGGEESPVITAFERVGELSRNRAPAAAVSVSRTTGLTVKADASGSVDNDYYTTASYTFSFGDGTRIGPQPNPVAFHTYKTARNYTVQVTVADSAGLKSTSTAKVNVQPPSAQSAITPSHHQNADITVMLDHGDDTGEVDIDWTGGVPAFEVFRSTDASSVVAPANKLGEAATAAWTDVPPALARHYYRVTEQANHPPELAPIGNKTAPLGATLTFSVSATDLNGDPLTWTATPLPLPPHAAFNGMTQEFTFAPTADEIGVHAITIIVSDGSLTDSETITITVPAPPPNAPTSFGGRLLDANSYAAGFTVPIVTATVSLLGTGISATSDGQGYFTLNNVPPGHQVFDIATATAQLAPDGSPYAGFREAVDIIAHTANVVSRPFFLPRIDSRFMWPSVDPNVETVIINPDILGDGSGHEVRLTIPPFTAKDAEGDDFIGQLSISLVPAGLAPAEMPRFLQPAMVITIQPVGVSFATPVPITFPNLDGLPTGNDMHLWSLLAEEGRFAVVGRSEISADGQRVETVEGGIRATDWHFVEPPQCMPDGPRPDRKCGQCPNGGEESESFGSSVGLAEGALQERYTLPHVRSMGVPRSLTLAYDSTTADVRPILPFDTLLDDRAAVPRRYTLSLEMGGVTQGAAVYYDTTTLPEDEDSTSRIATHFDASMLPTGRYRYTADVFSRYPLSSIGTIVQDEVVIVNRRDSPVGAGWGFAGIQRLHAQPDGSALIEDGTGFALIFEPAAQGSFTATSPMLYPRGDKPFAAPLSDGRLLLAGGTTATSDFGSAMATAELFDPVTTTWSSTDSMAVGRVGSPEAVVLNDGRVLIAGGGNVSLTTAAEIYDYAMPPEQFTNTSPLNQARNGTATRLNNGTVLVAGGKSLATAEVYDPVSGTFSFTNGFMTEARFEHTATLLEDGRVLIAGGHADCGVASTSNVEIYDPSSRAFTHLGDMVVARAGHSATLLPNGRVLIAGGAATNACSPAGLLESAEIFDPVTGTSDLLPGVLCAPKSQHSATRLDDGSVIIAGGWVAADEGAATDCADRFDPETETVAALPPMTTPRSEFAMLPLPDGRVLITGGGVQFMAPTLQSAEIFALSTQSGAFIAPAGDFTELTRKPNGTYERKYKDGTVVTFDSSGRQTSVVDRNGNETSYDYNVQGRLDTMTDPKNQIWELAYDANGKLASITDPALRITEFAHDARGDLIRITKSDGASIVYVYDSQHRLIRKTDERGYDTTYMYDFAGRASASTHANGEIRTAVPTIVQGLADVAGGSGTAGNPAPITLAGNVVAEFKDGNNHTSYVTLNRFGSATRREEPSGEALPRVTTIERDANNLPVTITRPNNSVVKMTYDIKGNLLTSKEENDPNGPATTIFTYEPVFNQIDSITDANQNPPTLIEHDPQGNPITITDARGKETILTWLPGGLLESVKPPSITNPTVFGYDPVGNLNMITEPLPQRVTNIVNNDAGLVETVTDPLTHVTQYVYDEQNRLREVIDAALGRTTYVYDAKGNLRSLTDARSKTTSFEYNAVDQVTKITNPLGQSRTFSYDLARNLRFANDAKGQQIEFIYDAANQLTTKLLKSFPPAVDDTVSFTYDDLGNLETATDGDSSLTFTPDPLGRIGSVLTGGTLPATTVSYTYDKNGNRETMTDPQGFQTIYDYDELNRLETLTSHQGVFSIVHDDASQRDMLKFPNDVILDYLFDDASQLREMHYYVMGQPQTLLSQYDYTYDDAGNRETRTTLDGVTTYGYDNLDRLTSAVGPDPANPMQTLTESYAYDAVGNRTVSHLATGQVHDDANRLLEDSRFTFGYDANGNLISKQDKATMELTTYDWDVEDRLVAVHTPTQTVTFGYDALGRRIEKAGGTTTRYVYDQEDIIEERDGTSALKFRYVHGPGIDEPLARHDVLATLTVFFHVDGLGSIADASNSEQPVQVSQTYRYDSYGNPLFGANSSGFAFTGREWDAETGLFYYRERYYDAGIGRFESADPIGFQGGINFYAYVGGNPVRWKDPFGLRSRVCCRTFPWSLGFRHCYVETEDASGRTSVGLIGGLFSGEPFATGNIYLNNGFDTGGDCGDWNEADCVVDNCVRALVSGYANPSSYRLLVGPNSNTFAATIARSCGLARPAISADSTPGWSDQPARQKPGTPYRRPFNLRPGN